MSRRTEIQIALLIVGVLVWGYGQRTESALFQYIGIGFFAAAMILRLLKKRLSG